MSYIGNTTQVANSSYRIVDDISSGFNGVTTSFAFKVSGTTPIPFPLNPQNCIISVNNVLLKPDITTAEGFWFSGSNIVFKVAPTSGHKFWGVILAGADYVTAGSLNPEGLAIAPSVTFYSSTGTGLFLLGSNTLGISTGGAARLAINDSGAIGIGGTSFGTPNQVLTSNGSGSAPSWQAPSTGPSISAGDSSATITDTGSNGTFTVTTDGAARLAINNFGAFGIGGTSFGTSTQVLTSNGSSSAPTWQTPAIASTISIGNTSATVTDTGPDGAFTVTTEGNARLTINSVGAFGIGGTSFGTSNQVLTSNGSGAAPSWQAPSTGSSILAGDSSATITDTGSNGTFTVVTEASTRFIINSSGAFGLGGSNFGTSNQVLTSNGSGSGPSWQSLTSNSIAIGNTNATVTDTGSDGTFTVTTEGVSRLTIDSSGLVSLSGNLAVTGTTTFTGIPTGPTAPLNTNTTQLATTAFVANTITTLAPIASPSLTGTPLAPTANAGTNTTQIATTAFVATADALKANLASPTFTGTPSAPTAIASTISTQIATTAFVDAAINPKANLASPTFTGIPLAPTANAGTDTTQIATTAFVQTKFNYPFFVANATSSVPVVTIQTNNATNNTTWRIGPYWNSTQFYIVNVSGVGQYMVNGAQAWTQTSDERFKDIIEPISDALTKINNIRAVIGKFKVDPVDIRRSFLIAQDVQAVFPEAVHKPDDSTKPLGLAYTDIIPLLVAAIKESLVRIESLEAQVTALETV